MITIKERPKNDLARNLKLLSARYKSIASLCQKMKINRQQFNKYLSADSVPSLHTLNRMADFFGVDETELLLPHEEFVRKVFSRNDGSHVPAPVRNFFAARRHTTAESQQNLKPYVGWYFMYYRSPSWPDSLIKSFIAISQDQQATYAKTIECLMRINKPHLGRFIQKSNGLVLYEKDRVFMFDQHYGGLSCIIIYPNIRNHIHFLQGLQLSVTSASGQRPFATRLVLERAGKNPNLRAMIKACGVYPKGSELIDPEFWQYTQNEISDVDGSLTARMI